MSLCSSEEEEEEPATGDGDGQDDMGVVEPRPFEVTSWKKAKKVRLGVGVRLKQGVKYCWGREG